MSEYIIDWDENLVIDTFSKNSLREEIVRCRDCKYAPFLKYGNDECVMHLQKTKPDNFCAWGERREGAES